MLDHLVALPDTEAEKRQDPESLDQVPTEVLQAKLEEGIWDKDHGGAHKAQPHGSPQVTWGGGGGGEVGRERRKGKGQSELPHYHSDN